MEESEGEGEEEGEAGPSEAPFPLPGFGEHLKDLKGKPLMRWSSKGKSVKVSTDLPLWSGKLTHHADAVTAACYGRLNYKELYFTKPSRLPDVAAQLHLQSAITSHHLGRCFRQSQRELKAALRDIEVC